MGRIYERLVPRLASRLRRARAMPPVPPLPPFPWFDVVVILLLIGLNGVFAMAEMAIVSSRKPRLNAMAKSGRWGAQTALDLASEPGRFLSTVQIGITLIGIQIGRAPCRERV